MTPPVWRKSLAAFFAERASQVEAMPTVEDLCYIAGRDPRLWRQTDIYQDLIASLVESLHLTASTHVLEVGCASGFLARGVAPLVAEYIGVDVAKPTLRVAEKLRLPNATFRLGDGTLLPQGDGTVDAAFCYDVFTNFPRFADGAGIIAEMLRVVKPGGRVLVGSIADQATREAYEKRSATVAATLEAQFGPPPARPARPPGLLEKIRRRVQTPVEPAIVSYYFQRDDFAALGSSLGVDVRITDIHPRNPYAGCRFNVVYTKPA
jgi:ubiquinone/menaquinone biosynthesis C-methylase UbiE